MTVRKPKNEAPLILVALVGVPVPGDAREFAIDFDLGVPGRSFGDLIDVVCSDDERKIGGIAVSAGCAGMAGEALLTEPRGVWDIMPEDAWRKPILGM